MKAYAMIGGIVALGVVLTLPPMMLMRQTARAEKHVFVTDLKEIHDIQEQQGKLLRDLEGRIAHQEGGGGKATAHATKGDKPALNPKPPPAKKDAACEDTHKNCNIWAACCPNGAGMDQCSAQDCSDVTQRACEGTWMKGSCPRTCGLCPGQTPRFETSQWRPREPVHAVWEGANTTEGYLKEHSHVKWVQFHKETPRVVYMHNVLSEKQCETLKARAAPKLKRSRVVDQKAGDRVDQVRTSQGMWIGDDMPERVEVEKVVSEVTGFPRSNFEQLQILKYQPGEYYIPHTDFFDNSMTDMLGKAGNRVATAIVFLNSIPPGQGGETAFPDALPERVAVTPTMGDGIVFYDMLDTTFPDYRSGHEAVPPKEPFEKWVAITWVRLRSW